MRRGAKWWQWWSACALATCEVEQLQDWAQLVGEPLPLLTARHDGRYTLPFGRPGDADRTPAGTVVLPGADATQSRTSRLKS